MLTDVDLTAEQLKRKRQMLLEIAIDAMSNQSGFQWHDFTEEDNYGDCIQEFYGIQPTEEDFNTEWEDCQEQIGDDIIALLKELKEKV